jgi:hypothetical protein
MGTFLTDETAVKAKESVRLGSWATIKDIPTRNLIFS